MKKLLGVLDASPTKRIYHSIISDYDLNRAICELIDNAIDVRTRTNGTQPVDVDIEIDDARQTIMLSDNAGGLKQEELALLVSPGQSGSNFDDQTIGLFGVGVKRAAVALAESICITTRYGGGPSLRLEYDNQWISDPSWDINYFEVDEVPEGTTVIDLSKLRISVSEEVVENLKAHLAITYARFLVSGSLGLRVNTDVISGRLFEDWSFPPSWEPRKYTGTMRGGGPSPIQVEVTAGLASESSPATGEYGVYFYCNQRLIARAKKTAEVGFTRGAAGIPHPKISLTRVIVSLQGATTDMPWNSSKSDINYNHQTFRALRDWLLRVVSDYAEVSRKWMGDWPEKVFKHSTGDFILHENVDFPNAKKSYLPPAPKTNVNAIERISVLNSKITEDKPWTEGAFEGVVAVEILRRRRFSQGNRISLIVLDSTLEIAFKEYLVNDSGTYYTDQQIASLFSAKHKTHAEVKKTKPMDSNTWKLITYFSDLRNKLIHERATVNIADSQIDQLEKLVKHVLNELYGLRFS